MPDDSRSPGPLPSVTDLLHRADHGDEGVAKELFATLYRELHGIAERQLRRQGGGLTLGATTLLHETFLSLQEREGIGFPDRARFLAYASKAMRGLIIDYSRARQAKKRGGEFEITRLGDTEPPGPDPSPIGDLDRLSRALDELETIDPKLARLVDLHFFCNVSFVELAAIRGVSDRTVQRDWRKARMLLHRLMGDEPDG
jgi:RNA polymerase sigma factor (TIGR02999 family)